MVAGTLSVLAISTLLGEIRYIKGDGVGLDKFQNKSYNHIVTGGAI